MKIRKGFVSNSSSSSFIVKDIAPREDFQKDYPPMSSMTEFLEGDENYNYLLKMKKKGVKEKEWARKRNVYELSLNGGYKYSIKEIHDIIKKHKYDALCLDHYEEDWVKYLESYGCIIMDISKVNSSQAKSLVDVEWGEDYIWNKCKFACDPYVIGSEEDVYDLLGSLDYTENPLFKMFIHSEDLKTLLEERNRDTREGKKLAEAYWKEKERYEKGKISEYPKHPKYPPLCNAWFDKLLCKWCKFHHGNVCFDVERAINEGNIFIYAKDNYLDSECIGEIEQTCQCILHASHMG